MAKKRRTKSQKINARHAFEYSWSPSTIEARAKEPVNRQKDTSRSSSNSSSKKGKNALYSDTLSLSVDLKKDLLRSLSLAGLVLGLELMLYFIW